MIRRTAALLPAVLLGMALAGCTSQDEPSDKPTPTATSSSAAPAPPAAQPVEEPAAKACYRLSYDEAVAPTSGRGPTECTKDHTAMTFAVGALDTLVDGHLLAVDSERVQAQVARECPARFATFVGGTLEERRLSMLRAVWFTPTVEESDAGADWFRCDVIAVAGDRELAPLTGRLAGVLGTEAGRDRYAMCGTAEPGTDSFERVVCSAEHSWRALRTVPFTAKDYPGEARVRAAGEAPCEAAGRAAADDALNFRWSYEWPTEEQWDNGQTYGLCWAPD